MINQLLYIMLIKLSNLQKELGKQTDRILDNFNSNDVVIINKDSYNFKR